MSMLPKSVKYQIRKLIDDLYDQGRRTIENSPYDSAASKLKDYELENLAGLLLLDEKSMDVYNFINEKDENCHLPSLVARYLISGDKMYAEEILTVLKNCAINYYKTEMEQLLEDKDFDVKHWMSPASKNTADPNAYYSKG